MKHNGIEYKEETLRDVIRYDGGAMGGMFSRYPSGMMFEREIGWHKTFQAAADVAQNMQRKKYEACREFIMQYEKETRE